MIQLNILCYRVDKSNTQTDPFQHMVFNSMQKQKVGICWGRECVTTNMIQVENMWR